MAIWYGSLGPAAPAVFGLGQDQQTRGQGQVVESSWAQQSSKRLRHPLGQADVVDVDLAGIIVRLKVLHHTVYPVEKLQTSPSQVLGVAASLTSLTFQ